MDSHTRLRLGCALALAVVVGGPFLWIALSGDGSGTAAPAPSPDTVEGVEHLLNREGKPEEALAACRALLEKSPPPDQGAKLDSLRLKCLERVMARRKEARDWAGCEAIAIEVAQSPEVEPRVTDAVDRLWVQALQAWAAELLKGGDAAKLDAVARTLAAHPKWRAVSWDDPVYLNLARVWRARLEAGDLEGADAAFAGLLPEPGQDGSLRPWRERREFTRDAALAAWRAGDAAAAERFFDAHMVAARRDGGHLSLKEAGGYLRDRLEALLASPDAATAFFERLHEAARGNSEADRTVLQALYRRIVETRWRRAADAGDWDAARKALAEDPRYAGLLAREVADRWQAEVLLMRWKAARAAGRTDEASAALAEVVAQWTHAVEPEVFREAVKAEWPPEQLLARGDEMLKKKLHGAALACFEALPPDTPGLAERVDRCRLALARQVARWAVSIVDWRLFERAEGDFRALLARPSFAADRAACAGVTKEILRLQLDWARLYAENEMFAEADAKIREAARRTAVQLWAWAVEDGADAWAGVPAAVRAKVEAAAPEGPERLAALRRAAEKGEWRVPQAEGVAEVEALARDRAAMALVQRARLDLQVPDRLESALDALRRALRLYPASEAAAEARETVESEIREAEGTVALMAGGGGLSQRGGIEAFTRLCDLLGFYVAEAGPLAPGAPFRAHLKASLTRAADLARGDPATRVFLLSLLADALPDEEAGRAAAAEALAAGREFVKGLAPKETPPPTSEAPSAIPGHSLLGIENRTAYHLLVFAFGKEEFFVRLNPWSRGVAVLEDGAYDTAVIVSLPGVVPYRGLRRWEGVMRTEAYRIERTGGGPPPPEEEEREVTGDFRLLRVPAGAGKLRLNPDTGSARPEK